jgi:hypothetical protein
MDELTESETKQMMMITTTTTTIDTSKSQQWSVAGILLFFFLTDARQDFIATVDGAGVLLLMEPHHL